MFSGNRLLIILFAGLIFIASTPRPARAVADAVATLQDEVRDLRATVERLVKMVETQQQQIDELTAKQTQVAALTQPVAPAVQPTPALPAVSGEPTPQARSGGSWAALLPDISVVGDVLAILTESKEDEEGNDAINLRELEVTFGGWADPWTRYDATVAFDDIEELAEVEEAYLTRFGLPFGFVARAGKFRSNVSKINQLHLHELPWADEPLVIRQYLGEEGFISSGARLSWLVPNPWDHYLEVTGEVLKGGNTTIASETVRDPIFTAHVSTYFPLSDDLGLRLGGSGLSASSPDRVEARRRDITIYGGDATLTWQGEEGRKLTLMGELLRNNRDIGGEDNTFDTTTGEFRDEDATGWYASGEFCLSRRWCFGGRYDWVEPLGVIADVYPATGEELFNERDGIRLADRSVAAFLTFYQSENVRFRFEWRHDEFAGGDLLGTRGFDEDDVFFIQATTTIGLHRHPVR
jgi:hypothetical protein